MILNVSGRCDIVAFFSNWFMKRYEEGFVDVRNPFYRKQVSRILMEDVDLIVFCTKNPLPILPRLKEIKKPILFHVTLTPYHKEIESGVPDKKKVIEGIKEISRIIGKENVFVRYDPIFLSERYSLSYHIKAFEKLCSALDSYVSHIIVSFIDTYKNVEKNQSILKMRSFTEEDYQKIGLSFSSIAKKHHMSVQTCSEERNLEEYGFLKRDCVDRNLAFLKTGKTDFKKWTSRNNSHCNCVSMVDIGVYNCCKHDCKYCYANFDSERIPFNFKNHDDNSTLLVGHLEEGDVIKIRK